MVRKCDICDKNYVEEEDEVICIDCAVGIELDEEAYGKYLADTVMEELSEEELNDKGISILWSDYYY